MVLVTVGVGVAVTDVTAAAIARKTGRLKQTMVEDDFENDVWRLKRCTVLALVYKIL